MLSAGSGLLLCLRFVSVHGLGPRFRSSVEGTSPPIPSLPSGGRTEAGTPESMVGRALDLESQDLTSSPGWAAGSVTLSSYICLGTLRAGYA